MLFDWPIKYGLTSNWIRGCRTAASLFFLFLSFRLTVETSKCNLGRVSGHMEDSQTRLTVSMKYDQIFANAKLVVTAEKLRAFITREKTIPICNSSG